MCKQRACLTDRQLTPAAAPPGCSRLYSQSGRRHTAAGGGGCGGGGEDGRTPHSWQSHRGSQRGGTAHTREGGTQGGIACKDWGLLSSVQTSMSAFSSLSPAVARATASSPGMRPAPYSWQATPPHLAFLIRDVTRKRATAACSGVLNVAGGAAVGGVVKAARRRGEC